MSWLGSIGEGGKVLLAWVLGTLVAATLTAGGSHGWSAVIFLLIVAGGLLGGVVHALLVIRRSRESAGPSEHGGQER